MVHHPWKYVPMIHDLIGVHINKVKLPVRNEGGKIENKEYDLDFDKDTFLKEVGFLEYNEVIIHIIYIYIYIR